MILIIITLTLTYTKLHAIQIIVALFLQPSVVIVTLSSPGMNNININMQVCCFMSDEDNSFKYSKMFCMTLEIDRFLNSFIYAKP